MPLYAFRCRSCGKEFEKRMSVEERGKGTPKCPSCGSNETETAWRSFYAKTSRKS